MKIFTALKKCLKPLAYAAISVWALAVTVPVAAQVYTAYAALDGSQSTPSYAFNSAANTGLSRDSGSAGAQMSAAGILVQRWLGTRGGEAVIAGHIKSGLSGAPVLSACGTSTLAGTDSSGVITFTAGGAACTLTFANAWQTAPLCTFNDNTTANKTNGTGVNYLVTSSTTAVTVTFVGTTGASDVVQYTCIGS